MKKKYNMVLIFLGILIVLLFMLFFLNKEGMTNDCTYQYLSPNQTNTPLDDATINTFMTLYDSQMNQMGSQLKLNRAVYDNWISSKVWCSEEIQYYIKNKYFPLNSYILYELKNNTKIKLPAPFTPSTIAVGYNSRLIYYQLVVPSYAGNPNLPPNTTQAQAIYSGTQPEPACSSDTTSTTPTPTDTSSTPTTMPTDSTSSDTYSTPTTMPTSTTSTTSTTSAPSFTTATSTAACNASCNDYCNSI